MTTGAPEARPARASSSSRTDQVFQQLRADILHGRLEPGSRLRVEALSQRYGVSSGVVREALPRLVGQGLAVALPQQGVRVISVDLTDLTELTEAAIDVETLVLRRSLTEGSIEWEAAVLAAHHQLSRLDLRDSDQTINDDWAQAHTRFHLTILAGCANRRLKAVAASLRDSGEVYRRWADRDGGLSQQQHEDNHRRIRDLVLSRDVDGATAELRRHIELTTSLIVAQGGLGDAGDDGASPTD